ncbi:MAG: tetratricopeptide repeat protein [Saprospiraceae bacterium]
MPEDTHRVRQLTLIAGKYIEQADYIKALPFAREGDALAHRLGDFAGLEIIRDHLANCQTYIGDYDKAFSNYLYLLDYWEKKEQYPKVARYYSLAAQLHEQQSDHDKALDYWMRSLKYWETINDPGKKAFTLWAISGIYKKKSEKAIIERDTANANLFYLESIACIEQSLKVAETENDTAGMASILAHLGYLYDKCNFCDKADILSQYPVIQSDYVDKAIEYQKKALQLYQSIGNELGSLDPIRHLGLFFQCRGVLSAGKGNSQTSVQYFQQSLGYLLQYYEIIHRLGFEHGIAYSNKDVGAAYLKLKDYSKAEKHLLKAAEIFKKRGFRAGLIETYELIAEMYEQKGDYHRALTFSKAFEAQKDSLANEESLKNRNLLIARYESDSKAREIELLKKDKEISEARARRQRIQNLAVGAGALLTGTISLLSVALIRSRRKREKMELTQQLQEVRQEAIKAQISDHFIANSMQSINHFVESNNPGEASRYLLQFSRLIRRVLENSADKGRAVAPLAEELQFLHDYAGLERLRYEEQRLSLHLAVDPGIDPETTMIPPMVLQILVENAIKHGLSDLSRGGEIRVRISQKEPGGHLTCSVEDNGAGRQAATTQSQRPARGTQLAGRLIALAQETGEEAHFQIEDITDEEGRPAGTRISFQFPFISIL